MTTWEHCNKEYDETAELSLPAVLPDNMCFNCGSTLTEEEIEALAKPLE